MPRVSRTTWVFPLCTSVLVALMFVAGRFHPPPQLAYKYFQEEYPLKGTHLSKTSLGGRGGWLQMSHEAPEHGPILPPDLLAEHTGTAMIFAQVADGTVFGTDRFLQTTFIFVNSAFSRNTGSIEFYDDAGNPLAMTLEGVTDTVFPFALGGNELRRFVTSGKGDLKVGWAYVHSEQPIVGTSAFGIRDDKGTVFTDVGVAASDPGEEFTLFADMVGTTRTGIAVANHSDTEPVLLQFELRDPSGVRKGMATRELPARGHFSLFVDDLFVTVPGVDEFEGSLFVTAATEFCCVTLRTTGDQWTSMPVVKPPPVDAKWSKLAFAHVGDGNEGGLRLTSSIILINNTGDSAAGSIEFFGSNGLPMALAFQGSDESSLGFFLEAGGVKRLVSDGEGKLKEGWAVVSTDQPIAGTGLFSIFDQNGLATEVGVATGPLQTDFYLVADSMGSFNTGIAIANPLPKEFGQEARIDLELHDKYGLYDGSAEIRLGPFQHEAVFLTELFPDHPYIDEYEGVIEVKSSQYVAPLCLRQAGLKLTSLPTLPVRFGFAPTSILEMAQSIAGTSPVLKWSLHQGSYEFALEELKITAPDLCLDAEAFETGERIGYGYYPRTYNTHVFELVKRGEGSLEFELLDLGPTETSLLGSGTMQGTLSGELEIELKFFDKKPFTFTASAFDFEFFLAPGLIYSPASAGVLPVTTEFTSVSTQPDEDLKLIHRTTQTLTVQEFSSTKASLLQVAPIFPGLAELITLEGTNFGDMPQVLFNFDVFDDQTWEYSQATVVTSGESRKTGELTVVVPEVVLGIEPFRFPELRSIQLDNGAGPGNHYFTKNLFGPSFQFSLVDSSPGAVTPFSLVFEVPAKQLAIKDFQVDLFNVSCDLTQLLPGMVAGTGEFDLRQYQLLVVSADQDEALLNVMEVGYVEPFGELTLETSRDGDGKHPGLSMDFQQLFPVEGSYFLDEWLRIQWHFTDILVQLPGKSRHVTAIAVFSSSPAEGTADSELITERCAGVLIQ